MPDGPAYWTDTDLADLGIYLDGRWIAGGRYYPPGFGFDVTQSGALLPTLGGSDVLQLRTLGGDVPVNTRPMNLTGVLVQVSEEADYWALKQAESAGLPVNLWADIPVADTWVIAYAASGQTTWKTSRALPWDLAGVDHSTRPPRVFIDGVEQALAAASPPGAGEFYVEEAGGYGEIETPAGITGTYLTLRYHPVLRVRIAALSEVFAQHNEVVLSLTLQEVRERLHEVAA